MNAVDIREERMNEHFTKYHLAGLPFDAVLHKFIDAKDEYAHDHPFDFNTYILKGSYVEEIYTLEAYGNWRVNTFRRNAGTSHYVSANTIHRIIDVPYCECWTLITPYPKVKDSGFYKFENGKVYFRYWWEDEFKIIDKL